MKTTGVIWTIVVVIIIIGAIWWFVSYQYSSQYNSSVSSSTVVNTQPIIQSPATSTVSIATDPTLGSYLTATNGMTLYVSSADILGVSKCTSTSCMTSWPAYTVSPGSDLTVGPGINGIVSSTTRSDGTMQVTYNGSPLYFWSNDVNPGDIKGNGVSTFTVAKP